MSRPHLPPEAGGDPSQGPVREMANPEPDPEVGNEFPDTPDANAPDAEVDATHDDDAD